MVRLSKKYPDCIGTFPACSDLRLSELCSECYLCSHYSEKGYQKAKRNEAEAYYMATKKQKIKEKSKVSREQRIMELLNKPKEELKPSEKAWLTIWKNKGIIQ